MLHLSRLSEDQMLDLERGYQEDGSLFLYDVLLPPGCAPAIGSVLFLAFNDGRCEVFIPSTVSYSGASPFWHAVFSQPAICGQTYLVLTSPDGFVPAWTELCSHIADTALTGPCPMPEAIPRSSFNQQPPRASVPASTSPAQGLTDLAAVNAATGAMANNGCMVNEDELLKRMCAVVRGQDIALRTLCRRVSFHLARRSPRRPLSLLMTGPTGVGKTKTAEELAAALKDCTGGQAGYSYLRLDMAEYQEAHRISQLIGSPQGYVGHGDGAQLPDALSANPKSVVCFDEIEKAHPNILRTLMNTMDAGRLSTSGSKGSGREIDCRQAIFLFTSNLAAEPILQEVRNSKAEQDQAVVDRICRSHLKAAGIAAELIGRVTGFLLFMPLSADTIAEIVTLSIVTVGQEYGFNIVRIDPAVVVAVLERTKSDQYGARTYEYAIDELLAPAFAKAVRDSVILPIEVLAGPPPVCVPAGAGEQQQQKRRQLTTRR